MRHLMFRAIFAAALIAGGFVGAQATDRQATVQVEPPAAATDATRVESAC